MAGADVLMHALLALARSAKLEEADGVLHVLNAPSPGATASLAIGRMLAEKATAAADPPTAKAFASQSGWILEPNAKDTVSVTLRSAEAWSGILRFEVCDADGKLISGQEQAVQVPANNADAKAETGATVSSVPE